MLTWTVFQHLQYYAAGLKYIEDSTIHSIVVNAHHKVVAHMTRCSWKNFFSVVYLPSGAKLRFPLYSRCTILVVNLLCGAKTELELLDFGSIPYLRVQLNARMWQCERDITDEIKLQPKSKRCSFLCTTMFGQWCQRKGCHPGLAWLLN